VGTPLDLTNGHSDDPVVALAIGHSFLERGFEFLLRDLLQIALCPVADPEWVERVEEPPAPHELRTALAPFRPALELDDPQYPAMQVRPAPLSDDRLNLNSAVSRYADTKPEGDDVEDGDQDSDEDSTGLSLPLSILLPEQPTPNVLKTHSDFFTHSGDPIALHGGLILPLFYAHMVLFPPGGGGYFSLPHGLDSIKYQIVGQTLWKTVWANVLPRKSAEMQRGPWPAPCDQTVFPWRSPELCKLPLGRSDKGAAHQFDQALMHPAAIPLSRRYLLDTAISGCCDLTGLPGPVYRTFRRWPKGPSWLPRGWHVPYAAPIETWEYGQNGWRPALAKAGSRETGPRFLRARGPLRFDDWIEVAVGVSASEPQEESKKKIWRRKIAPSVLHAFVNRRAVLEDDDDLDSLTDGSPLSPTLPFSVRAIAVIPDRKVMAATAERGLPLWRLDPDAGPRLALAVCRAVETAHQVADLLLAAAKHAGRGGRKADALRDALLARIDGDATELPGVLVMGWRTKTDPEARGIVQLEVMRGWIAKARKEAIDIFDRAFPIISLDGTTEKILLARRRLLAGLGRIEKTVAPAVEKNTRPRGRHAMQRTGGQP
jgi:CRISPR system Cascade subunit CasA